MIFVHLVGFEFTDDLGLGDLFEAVGGYILVTYDVEGVGYFDTLRYAVWDFSNSLAEETNPI